MAKSKSVLYMQKFTKLLVVYSAGNHPLFQKK